MFIKYDLLIYDSYANEKNTHFLEQNIDSDNNEKNHSNESVES